MIIAIYISHSVFERSIPPIHFDDNTNIMDKIKHTLRENHIHSNNVFDISYFPDILGIYFIIVVDNPDTQRVIARVNIGKII